MIQTIKIALEIEMNEDLEKDLEDLKKEIESQAIKLIRKKGARVLDSSSRNTEFNLQYHLEYKCSNCKTKWARRHRLFDQMEECPSCERRYNKPISSHPVKWREDGRTGGMIL